MIKKLRQTLALNMQWLTTKTNWLIDAVRHHGKLEYVYALIALSFGIIFIILIPPGWNPDEPQHYWRVQQLADGDILSDQFSNDGRHVSTGGALEQNGANFILSYGGYVAIKDYSFRLAFPAWESQNVSVTTKEGGPRVNLEFPGSARYSPVVYAPQIIGIWLAEHLGMSLLHGFFLAKILGLLTQIFCFFMAIRLIPRAKWPLFIVGLLPSTIIQSTAFGGDVMTTSVCILFISLVLKACLDKPEPSKKIMGIILFLLALISLVKPAYLPLGALLMLLPIVRTKYRAPRRILPIAGLAALASLPGLVWFYLTTYVTDNFGPLVNVGLQKAYVLHQPLEFLATFIRTYFTDDQPKLLKTLIGNFVWDTAPLPLIFMFIGISVLTISLFLSSPREKIIHISGWVRTVLIGLFFGLIFLISAALYIYYTDYRATSIAGIQGRYFIPLLILPLFAMLNPLPQNRQAATKKIVLVMLLSMLIASVVVIVYRVYI